MHISADPSLIVFHILKIAGKLRNFFMAVTANKLHKNCIKIDAEIGISEMFKVPSDFPRIIWSQLNVVDGAWHHEMKPAVHSVFYLFYFKFEIIIFSCFHKLGKSDADIRRWSFITQFCIFPSKFSIRIHFDEGYLIQLDYFYASNDGNANCKSECTKKETKPSDGNTKKNAETKLGWFGNRNCLCFWFLWDAPDYYFVDLKFPLMKLNKCSSLQFFCVDLKQKPVTWNFNLINRKATKIFSFDWNLLE